MSTRRLRMDELELCKELTVNVICHNKIHRVTLRKKGAITLHNHNHRSELRLAKVCKALDSSVPKCVRILQYWQKHQKSGYGALDPGTAGFGRLPPEVRNFRWMALRDRSRAQARRKSIAPGNLHACAERRFEWLSHRAFEPLFALHCRVREFSDDKFNIMNRERVLNASHRGRHTRAYNTNHWLFRIGASGLVDAIPNRFPLGIQQDEDGHEWLWFVDKDVKEERVDISNGDRPETVTGSESEAVFEEAIRKYRLMESTSRRDHENPYHGC